MNDIPAELQISLDLSSPALIAAIAVALIVFLLSLLARRQYLALPLLEPAPPDAEPPSCALVQPAGPDAGDPAEWLAFLHPAAQPGPQLLAALTAYAAAHSLDAAAVLAPPPRATLRQRAVAPFAAAIHFSGISAARVNDARHPMALLPPGCLILRRSVCAFFGGPRAVSRAFADPPALARRLKHHRVAYRLVRSSALTLAQPPSTHGYVLAGAGSAALLAFAASVSFCWLPLAAALLYFELWPEAALFLLLPTAAYRVWYPSWWAALLAPVGLVLFHLTALPSLLAAFLAHPTEPAPGS